MTMAPRTPDGPTKGHGRGGWTGTAINFAAATKLFEGYAALEKIELGH